VKLNFDGMQMEMEILPEANQLTKRLINTLLDSIATHGERYTSIGRPLCHGSWE